MFYVGNTSAQKIISATGPITDLVIDGKEIVVSTSIGTIETYNIATKKLVSKVQFDKTIDFAGDLFDTEVFNIIKIKNVLIAITRGGEGFNDVYSIINGKKKLLLSGSKIHTVIVDISKSQDDKLLLGLLSNELIKFDIESKRIIYRVQMSSYAFSAMCSDEEGKYIFGTDESGVVHKIDTREGKYVSDYEGQNVDNVLCIDYANSVVVCGGKDRRISIYNILSNNYSHYDTGKFITTIAISPSAKKIAWYDTDNNNIEVANTNSLNKVVRLKGHTSMVNKIRFIDENNLVSVGIDNKIIFWNL